MCGNPGTDLIRLCSGAISLVISAPYIKADALERVLRVVSPQASLICVSRWTVQDLKQGSSDTECYAIVREFGGSFRLHPTLHAKFYRIDDAVLVGSANLTFSGMGWSNHPNLEILCHPGEQFNAEVFQEQLLTDSREIKDEEVMRWNKLVDTDLKYESLVDFPNPQLAKWRPLTREPRNLELVYSDREEEIASTDERRAAQQDIQELLLPPGLSIEQASAWISVCLMESPFIMSVIRLQVLAPDRVYRELALEFDLELHRARRGFETVQNWLAYFAPETLAVQQSSIDG